MSNKSNVTLRPGWRRVKFGEVVRLSKARSQDPLDDGIERYVGLEHLEPGDFRIRSWGDVADGVSFTSVFHPGQVLFGKRRAYQRKVAVADFSGVCSGDIYVLETKDAQVLLPELLSFICQTDPFFEHAVGTSAGSLSPRTNWASLASFEFILPPVEEQQRISKLLTSVNAVGVHYGELREATSRLFMSSLEAAQGGGNFPSKSIAELCELVMDFRGRTPKKLGMEWGGGNIPALSANNVLHRRIDLQRETNYGSPELYDKWMTRGDLREDDILFTTEAPLGNVVRIKRAQRYILSQRVIAMRVKAAQVRPEYFEAVLCSKYFQRELERLATGTTAKGIRVGSLVKVEIPVPPLSYQEEWSEAIREISQAERKAVDRRDRVRVLLSKSLNDSLAGEA